MYAHTASRTVPTCDVRLGSVTLPAPEAGDFVGLIPLSTTPYNIRHETSATILDSTDVINIRHTQNVIFKHMQLIKRHELS